MAIVDTKVKITLIDGVSSNLAKVQGGMSDLTKTAAALAASFVTFESAISGIANIVKSGIEFNKTIETASVGMSGVLLSMTKLADRNLEWNEAMSISRDIIKDLNKQALLTAATPQELTQTFSGLMGIGLGRGLNIEQIKSFTVMGVNAVKSMGLEGRQLIQELRDLLQGSISPQKSTLATALGITTADIKAAQNSAEGLFKFLEARMNGFKISANYFPKTFQGATAVLGGAYQMLIAQTVEQPMQRIRDLMQEMFKGLLNEQQNGFSESITKPLEEAGKHLTNLISGGTELAKAYIPLFKDLVEYAGEFGAAFTDNIKGITLAFIGWKSVQGMTKSYAAQTLDVYSAINAKINENNAALAKQVQFEKLKAENRAKLLNPNATTHEGLAKAERRFNEVNNPERWKMSAEGVKKLNSEIAILSQDIANANISLEKNYRILAKGISGFAEYKGNVELATEGLRKFVQEQIKAHNAAQKLYEANSAFYKNVINPTLTGDVFKNLKLSAEQTEQIIKRVWATYQKSGEAAAQSLMKQIELEARLTVEQNKRAELLAKIATWYQRLSSSFMGFGMIASYAGEKLEDDFISNIGRWATEIGMLATAFQMLWASMTPVTAAVAAVGVAGLYAYNTYAKQKELRKRAETVGLNIDEDYTVSQYNERLGTSTTVIDWDELEKHVVALEKERSALKTNQDNLADLSNQLVKKFNNPNDPEAAAQNNIVKLLDNAKKISAEISAKLAQRSMTNEEQAFANLNKEIATFQAKIDDLKKAGQDITDLQAQLDNYSANAAQKLIDKFNTTKVRWDDVVIHIKNSQTNFTDIVTAGYDSLASAFTNFGENLITEGGSFMERFNNLLTNFANNVCNTLMKIYLQGLLTKSIMGIFGGGSSWLSDSTENASGWLSIGKYVVGHANGGVASGWSLVGEEGPELVNFSDPGRVYTADETRSMIGGGSVNVKVNVINESGTPMTAQQQGQAVFDGEGYVINVVMNAIATNKNGMRTLLQGAR